MSDLHLEFGGMKCGSGDVLILAGDVCLIEEMASETPQGKYYNKFFKDCAKNYNKVFYVLGNHEYYFGDYQDVLKKARKVLPASITLLNNETEFYEGVHFIGTTLWTNFNNESETDMEYALLNMSDYQVINNGEYGKLSPVDLVEAHEESVNYLTKTLPTLTQGPVCVITHHAPSTKSLKGDYVDTDVKACYATDLEQLIKDHPHVELWCHGHIHASNDYTVEQCRIVSNPRGYNGRDENVDFDPNHEITLNGLSADARPQAS